MFTVTKNSVYPASTLYIILCIIRRPHHMHRLLPVAIAVLYDVIHYQKQYSSI